ncbi:hypothetical protein FGO68_gene5124 [Halteria grandinella]|uniref:C2H2-type domain-containing protein n=1 Tax=Halteria grandinella TaxID=5974 RepID=A0A8J8NB08_HALGN|nr:hypothetical protein FGO68_gene5124 [Halteria grandinella]
MLAEEEGIPDLHSPIWNIPNQQVPIRNHSLLVYAETEYSILVGAITEYIPLSEVLIRNIPNQRGTKSEYSQQLQTKSEYLQASPLITMAHQFNKYAHYRNGKRLDQMLNIKSMFTPRPQQLPVQVPEIKPIPEPAQENHSHEEEKEQPISADDLLAAINSPAEEIQISPPPPSQTKKNQCTICNKEMSTKFNLTKHMKVVHSGVPKKYIKHIKKDKKFVCRVCNKAFKHSYNLIIQKLGIKKFKDVTQYHKLSREEERRRRRRRRAPLRRPERPTRTTRHHDRLRTR